MRAIGYDIAQAHGKLPEPGGAGNTLGPVSGAHFNPLVTLVSWSKGSLAPVNSGQTALFFIAFYSAARRSVSTTGRRSTSRRPHHPASKASTAPAKAPASGTHSDAVQAKSNT